MAAALPLARERRKKQVELSWVKAIGKKAQSVSRGAIHIGVNSSASTPPGMVTCNA